MFGTKAVEGRWSWWEPDAVGPTPSRTQRASSLPAAAWMITTPALARYSICLPAAHMWNLV